VVFLPFTLPVAVLRRVISAVGRLAICNILSVEVNQ
jgi:hypothetical protein